MFRRWTNADLCNRYDLKGHCVNTSLYPKIVILFRNEGTRIKKIKIMPNILFKSANSIIQAIPYEKKMIHWRKTVHILNMA